MHVPITPSAAHGLVLHVLALLGFAVFGTTWSYVVGGSTFGDRVMAMKWYMFEKGLQKVWNELYTFATRAFGGNITMTSSRTQFAQIDFAVTGDVTTVIPKNFVDPSGPNVAVYRASPQASDGGVAPGSSNPAGQPEIILFNGFNG